MSSGSGSPARAILYAFLANLGIAVAKLAAAIYTASGSMLAEAIHSLGDTTNQVLLFIGLRGARREPDAEHPLGYGKLSYFWSFIVALMLFSMGGLFSIYEGLHKLESEHELTRPWVGLLVLGLAVILESFSLTGCLREIKSMRGDTPLTTWLVHTRSAEFVVVMGEDVAAIAGLTLAFGFLCTAWITGDAVYDAWGSISIGIILILVAVFVAMRVQSLLLGKSAEPEMRALIDRTIAEDENVVEVLNTITLHFGSKVMLAAKIRMRPETSLGEAVTFINRLEAHIKEQVPEVGWCFIEPDREP